MFQPRNGIVRRTLLRVGRRRFGNLFPLADGAPKLSRLRWVQAELATSRLEPLTRQATVVLPGTRHTSRFIRMGEAGGRNCGPSKRGKVHDGNHGLTAAPRGIGGRAIRAWRSSGLSDRELILCLPFGELVAGALEPTPASCGRAPIFLSAMTS